MLYSLLYIYYFSFFFFWLHHMACGILSSPTMPLAWDAWDAWSLNLSTTREVPFYIKVCGPLGPVLLCLLGKFVPFPSKWQRKKSEDCFDLNYGYKWLKWAPKMMLSGQFPGQGRDGKGSWIKSRVKWEGDRYIVREPGDSLLSDADVELGRRLLKRTRQSGRDQDGPMWAGKGPGERWGPGPEPESQRAGLGRQRPWQV